MRRVVVLLAVVCVCVGVCAAVLCEGDCAAVPCGCAGVKFGQLCDGNPDNTRRTSDDWGEGHYGATQGGRIHKGLDINCSDGSVVYAPFHVTLHGKVVLYGDRAKAAIDSGINLRGKGLSFKLLYVRPDKTSGSVRKGQRIGVMVPMQSVFPGITSHIHVQMEDRSDPTPYFCSLLS